MPTPKTCYECQSTKLKEGRDGLKVDLDIGTFVMADAPAVVCENCGAVSTDAKYLEAFELIVAGFLAQHGASSPGSLRFMRKAIGLPAGELAELLDVTRETVSRWENGKQPLERRALAIVGGLVLDRLDGKTRTLDRLRMLKHPPKLAKTKRFPIDEVRSVLRSQQR